MAHETTTENSPTPQTDREPPTHLAETAKDSDSSLEQSSDACQALSHPASVPVNVPSAPGSIWPPTQIVYADPTFAEPPDLNYSLRTRKKWIIIFWSLVLLDVVAMPIVLYFALFYGTHLSHNAVFSISTGALGTVSIVEYFLRFHRLWRKGSTCRVIGAKRYYLDYFHWTFSFAWIAVMIELIVGTIPEQPPIRLLAMPVSSMAFALGFELLLVDVLRFAGCRAPLRISSLPRGAPLRPGIYFVLEDVVAVDGSGGTEFRQRLNLRYQASHMFRKMLHRLTLFWAFGAIGIATATTALVFTLEKDAAYVCGWTIPFVWAGIWAIITTKWVQRSLKEEHESWHETKWKNA